MRDLVAEIAQADGSEIEELLKAVIQRYDVLFPDWEVNAFSLQKKTDRNEQIDSMIHFLESIKTSP